MWSKRTLSSALAPPAGRLWFGGRLTVQEACIPLRTACQIPGAQAVDRGYLRRKNCHHSRRLSSGSVQMHGGHEIPGVFGMEGLHGPADFRRLGRKAAEATERMVSIAEGGLLNGEELLAILDEISDTLCLVLDTAELCRSVHPDPAFVQAADEECAKLGSMVQRLNTSSKQLSAGCSAAAKGLSKNTTDMIAQFIKHFC